MFKEKLKSFLAGVCVTAILAGTVTVFAEKIDVVMSGIKVYWDGIEKTLTDANGNKVEPMIYNGTTYVPVRAMANLLGKEVNWNQQEQAVIVGDMPVAESTPLSEMNDNISYTSTVYDLRTANTETFELKNDEYKVNNVLLGNEGYGYITYILEGNYTRFVGKAIAPYHEIGSNGYAEIEFYSVTNDGEGTLIKEYEIKQGEEAIDIDVNTTGVVNLRIVLDHNLTSYHKPLIYDAYFLGN